MLIIGQSVLQTASAHLQHPSYQHPLHSSARPVTGSHGHAGRADRLRARAAQTDAQLRERLGETSGVVTDQAVPEGHKGLHGFLYGEGGAEAHDSESQYNFREVSGPCSFLYSCSPHACSQSWYVFIRFAFRVFITLLLSDFFSIFRIIVLCFRVRMTAPPACQ